MAKNREFDRLLSDIKKRYNNAVKEVAEEVASQIEGAYENAIAAFYADYGPNNGDPWYYRRTYETYRGSNAYDDIYDNGIQQFGDLFLSGINVSSSNIPGNPYKAYKGWVFERTFEKGIHGINRNDIAKINRKLGKNDIRYTVKNVPTNMHPSPKKLMDQSFKKIASKKNLDEIASKAMKHNGIMA